MNVFAFSTPSRPEWRWRIVDYSGGMVEESFETFASIASAVSDGARRLAKLSEDASRPTRPAYLGGR
jgi:hypothetical protein